MHNSSDDLQLTLKNITGRPLYLEGLTFESPSGFFDGTRWDTEYLTAPLDAFPADDCLQIWSINTEQLSIPAVCEVRHAWATVNDDGLFWITAEWFDVYLFGERVTRCFTVDGVCRFRRDDWLPVDPTPVTTSTGQWSTPSFLE